MRALRHSLLLPAALTAALLLFVAAQARAADPASVVSQVEAANLPATTGDPPAAPASTGTDISAPATPDTTDTSSVDNVQSTVQGTDQSDVPPESPTPPAPPAPLLHPRPRVHRFHRHHRPRGGTRRGGEHHHSGRFAGAGLGLSVALPGRQPDPECVAAEPDRPSGQRRRTFGSGIVHQPHQAGPGRLCQRLLRDDVQGLEPPDSGRTSCRS